MTEAPAPEHVKHYVVEDDTAESGYRPHNEPSFTTLENPKVVYGPTTFKAAYVEFYRLRAEKAGVTDYCTRCGHFESHNSWCRVPSEEAKAAEAAAQA
jgi:hypothetical protein